MVTPTLSGLRTEAIKAIGNTWLGRVLIQGWVFIGLIGSYIVAIAFAVNRSKDLAAFLELYPQHPIGLWVLVLAPLVVILACVSLPNALRIWYKRRRDAIALECPLATSFHGYFRLDPYVTESPDEFHREDGAHQRVVAWLRQSQQPLLFLSGASGAGKSSVLEGFVLPKLRAEGWRVIEISTLTDPLPQLEQALTKPRRRGKRLLIIFDQFEGFAILESRSTSDQRKKFLERVRNLRSDPQTGVCLLFVFRSDYQSQIVGLELDDLRSDSTWTEIAPFERGVARRFLANAPQRPSSELVNRVLDGADALDDTPGLYRPVILNMLGMALQRFDQVFTGRPSRLVQDYLQSAIADGPIRAVAPRVIEKMITEASTKRIKSVSELAAEANLDENDVLACLNRLAHKGLARGLGDRSQLWELSHDFVARQFALQLGRLQFTIWPKIAGFVSLVLFVVVLIAAVFGVPFYAEYEAGNALKNVGVAIAESHGLTAAKFPPGTKNDALRIALPHLKTLKIQMLDLAGASDVTTLPALKDLPELQEINVAQTQVEDLQPLQGLAALRVLDLSETKVNDLEPLRTLKSLQTLRLYKVRTVNLHPLEALPNLISLDLSWVHVPDIGTLKNLTTLRWLALSGTSVPLGLNWKTIEDVGPVRGLAALNSLELNWTNVQNLEPLSGLTALQWLSLGGTKANLEPLKSLTGLQSLDLEESSADIEPLKALSGLQSLNLQRARIENFEAIRGVTTLQELDLGNTAIDKLEPLRRLNALQRLDLRGTRINSLEPLRGLIGLQWLDISFLHRAGKLDLEPLRGLISLKYLSIVGTVVDHLESIEDLPELRTVVCTTELVPVADAMRVKHYRQGKKLQPISMCQ
ncbi:MAG: hypothetical protein JO212_07765 [Acetobacteraceae bacterium]|nr:hypothetical protein [Acetobacteraceae bacterium]